MPVESGLAERSGSEASWVAGTVARFRVDCQSIQYTVPPIVRSDFQRREADGLHVGTRALALQSAVSLALGRRPTERVGTCRLLARSSACTPLVTQPKRGHHCVTHAPVAEPVAPATSIFRRTAMNSTDMAQEKSFRDIQVSSSEIVVRTIALHDLWQSLK